MAKAIYNYEDEDMSYSKERAIEDINKVLEKLNIIQPISVP